MTRPSRSVAHPFHGLPRLPSNPRTADELADQGYVLVKHAVQLAAQVRDQAPADIHRALGELDRQQLTALVVTLASMLDPDVDAGEALAWTDGLVAEPALSLVVSTYRGRSAS